MDVTSVSTNRGRKVFVTLSDRKTGSCAQRTEIVVNDADVVSMNR